jgi:thioredoxin 1
LAALAAGAALAAACGDDGPKNTADRNKPAAIGQLKVTFIELGSVRCIPCKAMQPIMREIEKEYGDQVKVVFYDVWKVEQAEYGTLNKIRAIPTQVFLDKDGKEYFRHEGYFPKAELVEVLKRQGVR